MRTASRHGYPDGFALSNQMKRLTDVRPSDVKGHIGWEWVLESWIQKEIAAGGFGREQLDMLGHRTVARDEGVASA